MAIKKSLTLVFFLSCINFSLCFTKYHGQVQHKPHYKVGNIYVNSIPKCGTHLLTKCIELLTQRPLFELNMPQKTAFITQNKLPAEVTYDNFLATHVRYSDQALSVFRKRKFKMFLIYRDPRDKAISQVYWIYKGGWNNEQIKSPLRKLPFKQLLKHVIKRIRNEYEAFLPWIKHSWCIPVRFESLIGPKGGGSQSAQIQEIKKIAKHIQLPLTNKLLSHCINNLFGGSPTFREGKIGGWVKHFDEDTKKLFKKEANHILFELGYEKKGTNW